MSSIYSKVFSVLSAIFLLGACNVPAPSVTWTEGTMSDEDGRVTHQIHIDGIHLDEDWEIWFSQFPEELETVSPSTASIVHNMATSYRIVPQEPGMDAYDIHYKAFPLKRNSWAPEGFYLKVKDEKPIKLDAEYIFADTISLDDSAKVDSDSFSQPVWNMVPQLKSVRKFDGETKLGTNLAINCRYETQILHDVIASALQNKVGLPDDIFCVNIVEEEKSGHPQGWYFIEIADVVTIHASERTGAFYAAQTLANLIRNTQTDSLPELYIEDWPDMSYRGMMLDVARNFTSKQNLLHLIDILAHYKVNVLHLHLSDDEGWRVEIPSLPELTSFGAFHRLPDLDQMGNMIEYEALMPSYDGCADPSDERSLSNGYYTVSDFQEILKYADDRCIRVLPEFDMPAHARAAIKAMEARARKTGDCSYLLSESGDLSEYVSAQGYTDNVMNVAMESTYRFIDTVLSELVKIYEGAGLKLEAIHAGCDEVPAGAWLKSDKALSIVPEGETEPKLWLMSHFIDRYMDIAAKYGLKVSGWQELVTQTVPSVLEEHRGQLGSFHCWNTVPEWHDDEVIARIANMDLDVVLSNVSNTYADLAYTSAKTEKGHSWGGYLNHKKSFSLLPMDIYNSVRWDVPGNPVDFPADNSKKIKVKNQSRIKGVQVQLFTETIRSFDDVTYYLFPKVLGVFERGWNAVPEWSRELENLDLYNDAWETFDSIVRGPEFRYLSSENIRFRGV